jgi:hypothetical protein
VCGVLCCAGDVTGVWAGTDDDPMGLKHLKHILLNK